MGAKAKVDAKLYAKIKKELKTSRDDPKVMKKYNLGQTTVRAIRNSGTYTEFNKRTRIDRRKKFTVRNNFKVNPAVKNLKIRKGQPTSQERAMMAFEALGVLTILALFFVIVVVFRWILSWFGI